MDILDIMGVSKLSANFYLFFKVNYSFKVFLGDTDRHKHAESVCEVAVELLHTHTHTHTKQVRPGAGVEHA